MEDLDSLPHPDFSLVRNWSPSNTCPVSTSRGCPYDCRFCSVIGMFGRRYRFKSVETALEELKHAVSVSKATKFIVDDNFAADKMRAKEILRGMIAEKIRTRWSAQVRTDVARDPELLRLMADSGCHTLFIGFESINPRTLEEYNEKQDLEDIISCIRKVRYHGIHIHGMFVLGGGVETIHRLSILQKALASGEDVMISGFGKFEVREKKIKAGEKSSYRRSTGAECKASGDFQAIGGVEGQAEWVGLMLRISALLLKSCQKKQEVLMLV
ncbi:MAG: radical SAM protein [Desulfatiglandales bacterium]